MTARPLLVRLPGVLVMSMGLVCAAEATTFEVAFMTDPVGPKALPLLAALIMIFAGLHATLKPQGDWTWLTRGTATRTGAATVAFLSYGVLLPVLGFFTSTTLVVSALSGLFGAPVKRALLAAAALSGALWLLFVQALGLPLPIGALWIR